MKYEFWVDNFPSLTAVQRSYAALGADAGLHLSVQTAGLLRFGPGGGGNDFLFLVPTQLAGAAHRSQFARSVYATDAGTASRPTRPALAVLATGLNSQQDRLEAYGVYILKEQGKARIARFSRWLNPAGVTLAEFDAPEPGTVLELRAGIRAVGADIEVLYDEDRAAFVIDESAESLQHGLPAIGKAGSSPPVVAFEWGGFEAGVIAE